MSPLFDHSAYSTFSWKSYSILHGDSVLKIGTDAILLGTWLPKIISHVASIVDAGCGSGILTIMAAAHYPDARITAIDRHEAAVALAAENIIRNNLDHRVRCEMADLLSDDFHATQADLVISNPPFFFHQLPSPDHSKREAKHAVHKPAEWMKAMATLVHRKGYMAVIVPFEAAAIWIAASNEAGWYCQQRLNVYSFATEAKPVRSLLKFGTTLQRPETESLVMYDKVNCLSDNYQEWLK